MIALVQIYWWVCQWKNFENRSLFIYLIDAVTNLRQKLGSLLFWATLYTLQQLFRHGEALKQKYIPMFRVIYEALKDQPCWQKVFARYELVMSS